MSAKVLFIDRSGNRQVVNFHEYRRSKIKGLVVDGGVSRRRIWNGNTKLIATVGMHGEGSFRTPDQFQREFDAITRALRTDPTLNFGGNYR